MHVVEDGAQKTAAGVDVVAQAREAFVTIGKAVEDMTGRVQQIAAASQEITASATMMQESIGEAGAVAEESSASTEQVSASTEQTSASTEEIAASAVEMANNADALKALVGHFNVTLATSGSLEETLRNALEAHNAWDARLREAIENGSSDKPVEQASADDRCPFGTWLHAPGQFRIEHPELWETLHDLHEVFHRNAGQVLELAVSGHAAEAKERMRGCEFAENQAKLRETLTGAIANV